MEHNVLCSLDLNLKQIESSRSLICLIRGGEVRKRSGHLWFSYGGSATTTNQVKFHIVRS